MESAENCIVTVTEMLKNMTLQDVMVEKMNVLIMGRNTLVTQSLRSLWITECAENSTVTVMEMLKNMIPQDVMVRKYANIKCYYNFINILKQSFKVYYNRPNYQMILLFFTEYKNKRLNSVNSYNNLSLTITLMWLINIDIWHTCCCNIDHIHFVRIFIHYIQAHYNFD